VQAARGLVSASQGDHEDAYWQLRRVFDPADPAHHPLWCARAATDLAESAVIIGRAGEAREVLARFDEQLTGTPLVCGQMSVRHAHAVLADETHAERLFRAAFEAGLDQSPFDRARLKLAFGAWLRRARRPAESREPLRHALATFGHLRATPWCERASQELRASGERHRGPAARATDHLSPQERQVAQLAAIGLSNREIGQRLFLSPRTVGSHLYRIFPKLNVTSRHELSAVALSDPNPEPAEQIQQSAPLPH
jgi:ATP/maltotriose-dependent transcriptional regulator MalT